MLFLVALKMRKIRVIQLQQLHHYRMAITAAISCEQEVNAILRMNIWPALARGMYSCHALYPWALAHIVVVSGSGPNVCGHTLLNVGQFYLHIDGLYQYPWHFNNAGYRRYLNENEKNRDISAPCESPRAR